MFTLDVCSGGLFCNFKVYQVNNPNDSGVCGAGAYKFSVKLYRKEEVVSLV